MKQFLTVGACILTAVFILLHPWSIRAQEEADQPTETPTEESEEDTGIKEKINDLKERLATKVAELRSQNKRSFYGVIKEKKDTNMTLLYHDQERLVAVNEETRFFSMNASSKTTDSKMDNFELGETATTFGLLDLDNKTIIASYIYEQTLPIIEYGTITEIDENDGSFTIESSSGTITLDYEITTRCTLVKDVEKTRCGLSSMNIGDSVFLRINPDQKDLSRATALRVLLVPITEKLEPTASSSPTPGDE